MEFILGKKKRVSQFSCEGNVLNVRVGRMNALDLSNA